MGTQPQIENVHQLIIETVPVFFFVYNLETKEIEYLSGQFLEYIRKEEDFFNLSPHEKLESLVVEEDKKKFHQFLLDLSKENKFKSSVELQTSKETSDFSWIEINTFKATRKSNESNKIVGHILDISKKKKQYEILNRENERLENFINMIAHDLRTPLANISLGVDVLKRIMTPEELRKYKKYLEILKNTTKDSGELITKLLHYATLKGEASKLDLDLHDIRYVVKDIIKRNEDSIKEKNFQIEYEFPDYSLEVLIDIILFRQVLQNLLANAIKFTPKGGRIKFIGNYTEHGNVVLSIEDTGIGIPESSLDKLFSDISSIKRNGLNGEKSNGLGLYICQQIMNIHAGSITASSKENEGSTFNLHFPIPSASSSYF